MASNVKEMKDKIDRMVGKKKPYTKRFIENDMNTMDALAVVFGTDTQKLLDLAIKEFIEKNSK